MSFGKALREQLWWLDIAYPLALAILLFSSLTYVLYTGQRQARLAPKAEMALLEFSLRRSAGRPLGHPNTVLVVNAEPADLMRVGRAPFGKVPDASVAAYARVLTRLADAGVPIAVVNWDIEAHSVDEVYYLPLIESLRRIGSSMKVYLAVASGVYGKLPQGLRELVPRTENFPCPDQDTDVAIECAYVAKNPEWIVQAIALQFGGKAPPPGTDPGWTSTRLGSDLPNYILDLSSPRDLRTLTFSELLGPSAPTKLPEVQLAVIGSNESDALSNRGGGLSYTRQVLTIYDQPDTDIQVAGTPLHVFWGMLAQMFIDRGMVRVPPLWVSIIANTVLCVLIAAAMVLFGGPVALGMFLLFLASAPFINALGIKVFQVYLPLFDGFYFGLSTFVAAGLGRLSVTAFQRWRLEAQRKMHAHGADLKGNFISLLSHNLNTPVAKMQGMLTLLGASAAANESWRKDLQAAEALVAQLEHSIRAVLIGSALEEGSLNETARSVVALSTEITATAGPSLKRLGLRLIVAPPTADEEDDLLHPLTFDVRALTMAIVALAALFRQTDATVPLCVAFHAERSGKQSDAAPKLNVAVQSSTAWIRPQLSKDLSEITELNMRREDGQSFLDDIFVGLVQMTIRRYRGRISLAPSGTGGTVTVTLTSATDHV